MTTRDVMMALLITSVLGAGVALRSHENGQNAATVRNLKDKLQQTTAELASATAQLSDAKKKLGFLEATKARVQFTAYALTDDFGPDPVFSNNTSARTAYAVPRHSLPAGRVLNVALSPAAERKLHANLNDMTHRGCCIELATLFGIQNCVDRIHIARQSGDRQIGPTMASRNVLEAPVFAAGIVQADPARQMGQRLSARPIRVVLMPGDNTSVMSRFTEQLVMPKAHRSTKQL